MTHYSDQVHTNIKIINVCVRILKYIKYIRIYKNIYLKREENSFENGI